MFMQKSTLEKAVYAHVKLSQDGAFAMPHIKASRTDHCRKTSVMRTGEWKTLCTEGSIINQSKKI